MAAETFAQRVSNIPADSIAQRIYQRFATPALALVSVRVTDAGRVEVLGT